MKKLRLGLVILLTGMLLFGTVGTVLADDGGLDVDIGIVGDDADVDISIQGDNATITIDGQVPRLGGGMGGGSMGISDMAMERFKKNEGVIALVTDGLAGLILHVQGIGSDVGTHFGITQRQDRDLDDLSSSFDSRVSKLEVTQASQQVEIDALKAQLTKDQSKVAVFGWGMIVFAIAMLAYGLVLVLRRKV